MLSAPYNDNNAKSIVCRGGDGGNKYYKFDLNNLINIY